MFFQVTPPDLDVYGHMNNSRYLALMDLGRMDLLLRTGINAHLKRMRWNPLVASVMIRYRRSLELGQKFTLKTRIMGWDHQWIYLEQAFYRQQELVGKALVKGLFFGPSGRIETYEALKEFGHTHTSPPIPDYIQQWDNAETSFAKEVLSQQ